MNGILIHVKQAAKDWTKTMVHNQNLVKSKTQNVNDQGKYNVYHV